MGLRQPVLRLARNKEQKKSNGAAGLGTEKAACRRRSI
jgi:hypothetical protein